MEDFLLSLEMLPNDVRRDFELVTTFYCEVVPKPVLTILCDFYLTDEGLR